MMRDDEFSFVYNISSTHICGCGRVPSSGRRVRYNVFVNMFATGGMRISVRSHRMKHLYFREGVAEANDWGGE